MPKGTKVARCVEKVKKRGGGVNPYAVCQRATGQSYATGRKLRSNMPRGVEQSPMGDLGEHSEKELSKAFPRRIKGGKAESASRALPFTREKTAGDYPGLPHIRSVSYDDVV